MEFSAKNHKAGNAFEGSSDKGTFEIDNHQLVESASGDYKRGDLAHKVDSEDYDANYIGHKVTMNTPFPIWKFIESEKMRSRNSFETVEEIIDFVGPIFKILESIHSDLEKKDIELFLSLCDERNTEMDIAYYMEKGTHNARLKETLESNLVDTLNPISIKKAQPMISPGRNVIELGAAPLISFGAKDESSFHYFPIFFRKEGSSWVITR